MKRVRLAACLISSLSWSTLEASPAETRNRVVDFESYAWDQGSMPEGCDTPFPDPGRFIAFFDASIAAMAAKRGAEARGVVDLFAISELRTEMISQFPSLSDESPLDRLIIKQVCQYRKIRNSDFKIGMGKLPEINSSDDGLHDHLVGVSARLYGDARKLMEEARAERNRFREKEKMMASKAADISRARALAREKVKDLRD
jgi:hypothetical protein